MDNPNTRINPGRGLLGISPVILFLALYVVVSACVGDFYRMPFSVALLCASAWGVAISAGSLADRVATYSKAAAHPNIIYMVWIFILAGAFASLAKEIGSVEATVELALRLLPSSMVVPGIFVAACFISLAVGTSVGTVVALTPLAVEIAAVSDGSAAFMVAVAQVADAGHPSVWLVLPYLMVIVAAVARMNVTLVLSGGIVAAMVVGMAHGHSPLSLCGFMGSGIESMGGLIVVTLMSAGMLGLVKANGGIDWMLQVLTARVRGKRGAQGCIALLVSLVNLCTANNTVAIITVGPLSKEISRRFSITPRKSASLLDTCSCIVQCLIPYGAQTLLACSLAGLSPAEPFRYLYYPWALAVAVIVSIMVKGGRK